MGAHKDRGRRVPGSAGRVSKRSPRRADGTVPDPKPRKACYFDSNSKAAKSHSLVRRPPELYVTDDMM